MAQIQALDSQVLKLKKTNKKNFEQVLDSMSEADWASKADVESLKNQIAVQNSTVLKANSESDFELDSEYFRKFKAATKGGKAKKEKANESEKSMFTQNKFADSKGYSSSDSSATHRRNSRGRRREPRKSPRLNKSSN